MNDHDDFADLEADLRALRPRGASAGFLDRVDTETTLRALHPRRPSAGFNDRVAVACGVARPTLLRFPVTRIALGLAAALAVALLVTHTAGETAPAAPGRLTAVASTHVPAADTVAPEIPADAAYARADDGTILPVINLGDGRAYRPTLRPREAAPNGFRATPAGILPASYGAAGATLEYSPVEYE